MEFVKIRKVTAEEMLARRAADLAKVTALQALGVSALERLFKFAQGAAGQGAVIARFLAGLYNGPRFPFDLTELRRP